jgi:phage gp29-like protein
MSTTLKKQIDQLNKVREQYNPLRSLTMSAAVSRLEQAERGIFCDLQWTYRTLEKRYAVLRGLKRLRIGALLDMDWDIRTFPEDQLPKGCTQADADAQADRLRAVYENIGNLREAIKALGMAEFRGFTFLEKTGENGQPVKNPADIRSLQPIEQWFWSKDRTNTWRFDPNFSRSETTGTEADLSTLIFREVEDPINEIGIICFIYEALAKKDYAGFIEVFGIPSTFFIAPPGVSTADMATWQAMADAMMGDQRGALPAGSDVKTVGGDVRGVSPFENFIKLTREDLVLAGTSGKLTMLTESGSGTLAGGAHMDVFEKLAAGDAREISELLQNAIDLPLLKAEFPNKPPLAWFEIAAEEKEDTTAFVDNVAKLAQAGYITEPDQVQEKTGLRVEYAAPPVASGQWQGAESPLSNRAGGKGEKSFAHTPWYKRLLNREPPATSHQPPATDALLKSARQALSRALAQDMKPVADRIAAILDTTPDAELFQALEKFRADELPALAKKALAGTAGAEALEQSMVASLFNGIESQKSNV